MPYTVVLIEDEPLVLKELAEMTPWECLGLELIGTAQDGFSGEKIVKELKPDIVLTDIRLPGIDGLELLSRCCVEYALILSGYTDFQYTKRAIQLGVFDYIQKPIDDEELFNSLASLVSKLDEEYKKSRRLVSEKGVDLPVKVDNILVQGAIDFIRENYSKNIGLRETADFLSISESHLSRMFKEVTGFNCVSYLKAYRISNAILLLRDPRLNVSEIAASCGFPNPGYFTKTFRQFTGKTPSNFRN